jgi:RHS repeat-associated protein
VYFDGAWAPFGEHYAGTGTSDRSFTGQTQDTVTGVYDFPFRQQHPVQGRWLVPDPAGLAAVDITNPQTWNRYAYVGNNPLSAIDSYGLFIQACFNPDGCSWSLGSGGVLDHVEGTSFPSSLGSNGITLDVNGTHLDAGGNYIHCYSDGSCEELDPENAAKEYGYLGVNNPYTPLGFTPWQWQSILSAKNGALHRLTNPKCSAFFGSRGSSVLGNTAYSAISLSNSSIYAETVPGSTTVSVNTNGYALDPGYSDSQFFQLLTPGGVSQGSALQISLLHELGHELNSSNFFQNDWNQGLNNINTIRVGTACGW